MKKLFVIAAALFAVTTAITQAATSFLLIQGPFGVGGAVESFKWQISYQEGAVITGQDLLYAILGTPSLTGTNPYNGKPFLTSGNSEQGAGYSQFSFGLSLSAFTLNSTTVMATNSISWSYYVAGGGGVDWNTGDPVAYASDGAWIESNDGMSTRTLSNGSYDGWVFGTTNWMNPAAITGDSNTPTALNFADATSVPEPGSIALLFLGLGSVLACKRVRR